MDCPVLLHVQRAHQNLYQRDNTGYLFNPNDTDDFSKKLKKKSDAEFMEMGDHARQFALEKFSIANIAARYYKLYKKLLQ